MVEAADWKRMAERLHDRLPFIITDHTLHSMPEWEGVAQIPNHIAFVLDFTAENGQPSYHIASRSGVEFKHRASWKEVADDLGCRIGSLCYFSNEGKKPLGTLIFRYLDKRSERADNIPEDSLPLKFTGLYPEVHRPLRNRRISKPDQRFGDCVNSQNLSIRGGSIKLKADNKRPGADSVSERPAKALRTIASTTGVKQELYQSDSTELERLHELVQSQTLEIGELHKKLAANKAQSIEVAEQEIVVLKEKLEKARSVPPKMDTVVDVVATAPQEKKLQQKIAELEKANADLETTSSWQSARILELETTCSTQLARISEFEASLPQNMEESSAKQMDVEELDTENMSIARHISDVPDIYQNGTLSMFYQRPVKFLGTTYATANSLFESLKYENGTRFGIDGDLHQLVLDTPSNGVFVEDINFLHGAVSHWASMNSEQMGLIPRNNMSIKDANRIKFAVHSLQLAQNPQVFSAIMGRSSSSSALESSSVHTEDERLMSFKTMLQSGKSSEEFIRVATEVLSSFLVI